MKGKSWTEEEVERLELHYKAYGLKNVRIPGRSLDAIKHKLSALMLSAKPTLKDFRRLMIAHPGRTTSWYARKLNVHKNTAIKYIKIIRSHEAK